MVRSVFVGLGLDGYKYRSIGKLGANHFILAANNLDKERWRRFQKTDADLSISINAFDRGGCPVSPLAEENLRRRIKKALAWKPKELWLDHFRFDGHWESTFTRASADKSISIPGVHKPCRWCDGKDRVSIIMDMALKIMGEFKGQYVRFGYFAVPFIKEEVPDLAMELGQDHTVLGKIFDIVSPMLYHRMIKKPVSYISEYVTYLSKLIPKKAILPIIQIKDMPDDLPDQLRKNEFEKSFFGASQKFSVGVSVFVWEHAFEKNKIGWIREVFSEK